MADERSASNMLTPRENETLIGHEAAEQVLIDAAVSGRLAHAWLLTGPRGIGKATLAYRFARYLLAQGERVEGAAAHPISLALDPSNPVFRRIAAGGHADLRTVERTVNVRTGRMREEIVVDDVRGAGAFLRLTPAEGGWRVVIIDSADELNQSAANAVLKVLEEPPERAVLILVSQSPARLLATIRSRCRRLVLRPLAETEVAGLLEGPCPELSAEERGALAPALRGQPRARLRPRARRRAQALSRHDRSARWSAAARYRRARGDRGLGCGPRGQHHLRDRDRALPMVARAPGALGRFSGRATRSGGRGGGFDPSADDRGAA